MKEALTQLKKCTVCNKTFILKPLPEGSFRFAKDQCSWFCYNHANNMKQISLMLNNPFNGVSHSL